MKRYGAVSLVACVMFAVAMLGCDEGSDASNANITGVWDMVASLAAGGTQSNTVPLEQSGTTATGTYGAEAITFTVTGQAVAGTVYTEGGGTWERTTFTGAVSAVTTANDHMEGDYTYETGDTGTTTPTVTADGTWSADLTTRALYDLQGTWDIVYNVSAWGSTLYYDDATLFMAPDGTVSGTYYHAYGPMTVTGTVYGLDVSLMLDDGSGWLVYVDIKVDPLTDTATGVWWDNDGYGGDWDAVKQ